MIMLKRKRDYSFHTLFIQLIGIKADESVDQAISRFKGRTNKKYKAKEEDKQEKNIK